MHMRARRLHASQTGQTGQKHVRLERIALREHQARVKTAVPLRKRERQRAQVDLTLAGLGLAHAHHMLRRKIWLQVWPPHPCPPG